VIRGAALGCGEITLAVLVAHFRRFGRHGQKKGPRTFRYGGLDLTENPLWTLAALRHFTAPHQASVVTEVLINRAAELTGYSEDAIRHKVKNGTWAQGRIWRKAPDGRITINISEYDKWAESASQVA
jgi:hypothetical protein